MPELVDKPNGAKTDMDLLEAWKELLTSPGRYLVKKQVEQFQLYGQDIVVYLLIAVLFLVGLIALFRQAPTVLLRGA